MTASGNNTTFYSKFSTLFQVKKPWDSIIIFLLNILIAIPVFIIVYKNIIDFNLPYYIDRIVLFVLILAVIQLILRKIKKVLLIGVLLYIIVLTIGSFSGQYGFKSVISDYNSMLFSMNENPFPQDIIINKLLPFPNKSKVLQAIDYKNPKVRNFALMATTKHFKDVKGYPEYTTIIQSFAVFKEINSNWNYVSDPKGEEYIASASESIKHLSGDCDDHSILMAACIRAVGGTPRLIHTDGHIYPEILIGKKSDLEAVNYLIKKVLFEKETQKNAIHYHVDEREQIWLNLDYTARYPGGRFMHDEILGILVLE